MVKNITLFYITVRLRGKINPLLASYMSEFRLWCYNTVLSFIVDIFWYLKIVGSKICYMLFWSKFWVSIIIKIPFYNKFRNFQDFFCLYLFFMATRCYVHNVSDMVDLLIKQPTKPAFWGPVENYMSTLRDEKYYESTNGNKINLRNHRW